MITIFRGSAYKDGKINKPVKAPAKLIEIQDTWTAWQTEYGDKGSCVLGAGFEFEYEGEKYSMPPAGPWQGSASWEASQKEVKELLEKAGATNIRYKGGYMD